MCSGDHDGSIPVGDSDISLSHARVMLINSSFIKAAVCIVTRSKNVNKPNWENEGLD